MSTRSALSTAISTTTLCTIWKSLPAYCDIFERVSLARILTSVFINSTTGRSSSELMSFSMLKIIFSINSALLGCHRVLIFGDFCQTADNWRPHFYINVDHVDLGGVQKNLEQSLLNVGWPTYNGLIFGSFLEQAGQCYNRLGLIFFFQKCFDLGKQIFEFPSWRNRLDDLSETEKGHVTDFRTHFFGLFFIDGNYFFFEGLA